MKIPKITGYFFFKPVIYFWQRDSAVYMLFRHFTHRDFFKRSLRSLSICNRQGNNYLLLITWWVIHKSWFFKTGVTSVSAAPIEGALPIPIWKILTPDRWSSTYVVFCSFQKYTSTQRRNGQVAQLKNLVPSMGFELAQLSSRSNVRGPKS